MGVFPSCFNKPAQNFPSQNETKSYWLSDIKIPSATLQSQTDIVIIGGGISGLSCLYHALQINQNSNITLIDARGISGGATGRNGGLCWPDLGGDLDSLLSKMKVSDIKNLSQFEKESTKFMLEFTQKYLNTNSNTLDPFFTKFKNGGLRILKTKSEVDLIASSLEEWRRLELNEGLEVWDSERVFKETGSSDFAGALWSPVVYQVVASRIVLALALSILNSQKKNCSIVTHTMVNRIEKCDDDSFKVYTSKGIIKCLQKVVYCTNAYTSGLLDDIQIIPVRNQVMITKPILNGFNFGFAISMNFDYEYLSSRQDNRIVLGGLRYLGKNNEVDVNDDAHLDANVSKGLHEHIGIHFPSVQYDVDQEWAGIMGFTPDSFPLVGQLRKSEFICAGFSGHGMTRTFLCGKLVAELVLGKEASREIPSCFLPHRKMK